MSALNEHPEPWPTVPELSIDELARQQGVKPIESLDELAQPDLWGSDEEYEEFLVDLYSSRRSDVA
jgi:hypothetical protein